MAAVRAAHPGGPSVVALAMTGLTENIRRVGADPDTIYDRVGLSPERVHDPMGAVPLERYCHLLEHTAAHTGDGALGLRMGAALGLREFGPLGTVMAHAPTLGVALRKLCQYFEVYQGASRVQLLRDGARLRLEYEIQHRRVRELAQDAELTLALFTNIFRHGRSRRFAEVHFQHAAPKDIRPHHDVFAAPVHFGQATNALIFDAAAIGGEMPDSDPVAMSRSESDLAARRPCAAPSAFESSLRQAVAQCFDVGTPRVDEVAAALGMTRGSLLRRMQLRGIEFATLVRDLRRERALVLLHRVDLPLTDIAMTLGYSEHSAFTRAFRGWTGISPRGYRARAIASGGR